MSLTRQKEFFQTKFDDLNGASGDLHQTMRAVEMEKEDLVQTYKEVCLEN